MRAVRLVGVLLCLLPWAGARAECSVEVYPVNFGPLQDLELHAADGEGSLVVNCDTPRTVRIGLGTGTGGVTANQRRLTGSQAGIAYQLFSDAGRSRAWGDGQFGVPDVLAPSGTPLVVYGRVAMGQRPPPGDYSDLIEVIIDF